MNQTVYYLNLISLVGPFYSTSTKEKTTTALTRATLERSSFQR